jgi:RNA polymerase sigma factor (sigma-70 family)
VTTELALQPAIPALTVIEAAAGDAAALARIVSAYHDDMARLCYVICGDQDLAQDAVQSAWSIVWRKLGSLRDPARLRPWLLTVAANEVRRLLRDRQRRRVIELDIADLGSSLDDPATRDGLLDLAHALRRLGAEDRTLLAMRYLAGFDSAEIGAAMGISADAARARLSRLVARLRRELADV